MASPPQQHPSFGSKKRHKKLVQDCWRPSNYPYETDYNDHFETPLQAYLDAKPLLDWLGSLRDHEDTNNNHEMVGNRSGDNKKKRRRHPVAIESSIESTPKASASTTLYDPYFCNGRTAVLLRELGYENVIHEKRDFYADIAEGKVPEHDILITNPPYSDAQKKRCLEYCFEQLRGSKEQTATTTRGKPFLILMPSYTASKQYYRDCSGPQPSETSPALEDVVYLVPSAPYHYDHPQNTGKDKSPFDSLWFCGIGKDRVAAFQRYWESLPTTTNRPILATSLADLQAMNVITFQNRPNPRKRGKKRKQMIMVQEATGRSGAGSMPFTKSKTTRATANTTTTTSSADKSAQPTGIDKKSKYRDPSSGKRTKKRF